MEIRLSLVHFWRLNLTVFLILTLFFVSTFCAQGLESVVLAIRFNNGVGDPLFEFAISDEVLFTVPSRNTWFQKPFIMCASEIFKFFDFVVDSLDGLIFKRFGNHSLLTTGLNETASGLKSMLVPWR